MSTVATAAGSPEALAAQYEELRSAALGSALPPRARSGLMLFLRRGMWGWACVVGAAPDAPREPAWTSPAAPPAQGGSSAVVHALAAIATSNQDRRPS